MHLFLHIIKDTISIMPFIFIIYLVIEYLEHKTNTAISHTLMKAGKMGSVYGALLGSIPQCGFSVIASDMFSRGAITVGTLVAIFIATSDEAVPIILSHPDMASVALKLIGLKIVFGVVFGLLTDIIWNKTHKINVCTVEEEHEHFHGNCESCEGGILKSALRHTLKIFVFVLVANVIFTFLIEAIGEESLADYLLKDSVFQPFVASLIGLIPNCAASVLLAESYLSGVLNFGSLVAGLVSGAGVGMLLLFKRNKNIKENLCILLLLYAIGIACGFVVGLV